MIRNLAPDQPIRSLFIYSFGYRISLLPIDVFQSRVDLSEIGVQVGHGILDEVTKELPTFVVAMRVFGWYPVLYVVRGIEDSDDWQGMEF